MAVETGTGRQRGQTRADLLADGTEAQLAWLDLQRHLVELFVVQQDGWIQQVIVDLDRVFDLVRSRLEVANLADHVRHLPSIQSVQRNSSHKLRSPF